MLSLPCFVLKYSAGLFPSSALQLFPQTIYHCNLSDLVLLPLPLYAVSFLSDVYDFALFITGLIWKTTYLCIHFHCFTVPIISTLNVQMQINKVMLRIIEQGQQACWLHNLGSTWTACQFHHLLCNPHELHVVRPLGCI